MKIKIHLREYQDQPPDDVSRIVLTIEIRQDHYCIGYYISVSPGPELYYFQICWLQCRAGCPGLVTAEREREREKASQLCQPASTMAVAGDSLGGRLTRAVSWSDKVWEIITNYELWFVMREVRMLHNYASDGLL